MKVHLNRAGQSLGQFTPEEIRSGYRTGKFAAGDLAWQDGMPTWRPLSAVIDEIAPESLAEFAPPLPVEQSGLPWEKRPEVGFFAALFETARLVLMEPKVAFGSMKQTGGMGAPLFYYVVLGCLAGAASLFYQAAWQSAGAPSPEGDAAWVASWLTSPLAIGASFLALPVYVVLEVYLSSFLNHGALLLLGGARRPFQATFRVVSYAGGSSYVLQLLPIIGVFAAIIYNLMLKVIGLSEVHGISKARAAVAVLLPAAILFTLWLVAVVALIAFGVALLREGMQGV